MGQVGKKVAWKCEWINGSECVNGIWLIGVVE